MIIRGKSASTKSATTAHNALDDEDDMSAVDDEPGAIKYDPMEFSDLLRPYIYLANVCHSMTKNPLFELFVMTMVVLACLLVGCQTYPALEHLQILAILESFVLGVFCVEIILKIVAEGIEPWKYFIGREWRWNWFDFSIVILSLPGTIPAGGFMLRLLRLARLGKLFKQFPEVMVIVMGLIGGLKSIGSIMFLLMFSYYLYAMVGMSLFRVNDPFHFDTLRDTFLTLYRCSTMEDWTDVMVSVTRLPNSTPAMANTFFVFRCGSFSHQYINVYGCLEYPGGSDLYVATEAEVASNSEKWLCAEPHAQPGAAVLYFVSFTLTGGFVMLSMFVGAVTLAMSDSVEQAQAQKIQDAQKKKRRRLANAHQDEMVVKDSKPEKKLSIEDQRELNKISALVKTAWDGQEHEPEPVSDPRMANPVLRLYYNVSLCSKRIVSLAIFRAWILILIVLAGILIGLESDRRLTEADKPRVNLVEQIIKISFTVECALKIVAQGFRPWMYFKDTWNLFDFLIVGSSWWPSGGSVVQTLRLFRLVAILKMADSFPTLQVNIVALARGLRSIGPIGVLMLLLFYVYAILGVLMFRDNDPQHFLNLHTSFLSLFRISTFEDWTDIMYINILGCDEFGYAHQKRLACTKPEAHGWAAIFFFVSFTILSSLIMLNLFIGVITTNMETATSEKKHQDACNRKVP
jgi:voltage-gated sodium channel